MSNNNNKNNNRNNYKNNNKVFLANIGRAATDASLGAQSWIVKLLGKIINDKKKYIRVISSEH